MVKYRKPKYKKDDTLFIEGNFTVKIIEPISYEKTDYGWDWKYLVEYPTGAKDDYLEIDLSKKEIRYE